jgi:hypothetical protein
MTEPLSSSRDQAFDLESDAIRMRRNSKIGRIVAGLIGGSLFILGIRVLLLSPEPLQVGMTLVFAALCWEFSLLIVLIAVFKKPSVQLTGIRITATAVTLTFDRGREVTQPWASEQLGLTFNDTSLEEPPRKGTVRYWTLFAPGGMYGRVPEPVAAAIIQAARFRGVSVSTRQETVGQGKGHYEALVTRIGRADAAPTPK